MQPRHFLDICDLDQASLRAMLSAASAFKSGWRAGKRAEQRAILDGEALAMIFEKPSTRTRVSFDLAMRQMGGESLVLTAGELQLGRGETIADTARVLSRYADIIMIRSGSHADVEELAASASIPVINGLTERSHPCQVVADLMTFEEHAGTIDGQSIAWVGDGNNVAQSWVHAAGVLGFNLRIAAPAGFAPDADTIAWARGKGACIEVTQDPVAAVKEAACVVTDTWVSMSDGDAKRRKQVFRPFQVTSELMAEAAKDAIFMHCLPAHRGDEVAAEVIDGPQSVVWDEAENRLHAQKAILAWCLNKAGL